jgi:hypothetical protein
VLSSDEEAAWNRTWAFRIGTFSPSFWAGVVQLQLSRIEAAVDAHRARRPHPERRSSFDGFGASMTHGLGPLNADAFFLVIAADRLAVLGRLYKERFTSPQADEALARFNVAAPDLKAVRDVLTHLDEYATGRGRRPRYQAHGVWWPSVGIDVDRDEVDLRLGTLRVELKRTARAALNLARTLNQVEDRI